MPRWRKQQEQEMPEGVHPLEGDDEGAPEAEDDMPKTSKRRGAHRALVILGVILSVFVLAAGALALAGYQFSERYEGRILPGAQIAGVGVGGMTQDEAIEALRAEIAHELDREIELAWKKKTWTVTPRELGARGNARAIVEEALEHSNRTPFVDKVRMRVLSDDFDFERDIAITYPEEGAQGFIKGIAASLDRDAEDAAIDYSSGWVELTKEKAGRKVQVGRSHTALMEALSGGSPRVELAVREVDPEKTKDDFKQVLLLRIGENKLYLYQDGDITHTWTVATGQPEYPTPQGLYEVTLKRYLPTWVNPSPDGWGADMPASIPPGPGNPLGVRAINWDAPAIRFHGTSAVYSLGFNASHGCVRMANSDVIQLYDLIEVGTPIVSIQAGALKPMYASAPDPTPVDPEGEAVAEGDPDSSSRRPEGKKKSSDEDA